MRLKIRQHSVLPALKFINLIGNRYEVKFKKRIINIRIFASMRLACTIRYLDQYSHFQHLQLLLAPLTKMTTSRHYEYVIFYFVVIYLPLNNYLFLFFNYTPIYICVGNYESDYKNEFISFFVLHPFKVQ